MMIARACVECGLVDVPVETWRCPTCRIDLLAPDDPQNDAAIDEAIELRAQLLTRPSWRVVCGFLAAGAVILGVVLTNSRGIGKLAGTLTVMAGFAIAIPLLVRRRMTPEWRRLLQRRKRRS